MNPDAMIPFGLALLDYIEGETEARLVIRRDDGLEVGLPVSHFFRPEAEFSAIEMAAIERCHGSVLDVGAGSGLHSLVMQSRGSSVTALDLSPQAAEIMSRRGVRDVRCADVLGFRGGPFDALVMLGHGIGMVEDLRGLADFLAHARELARIDGSLLIHSLDVRRTEDPQHLAYHEANRRAGRYVGETRVRFEYRGKSGPYCGWLHVDPETLEERAERAGWKCSTVLREESGDYLASLTR